MLEQHLKKAVSHEEQVSPVTFEGFSMKTEV